MVKHYEQELHAHYLTFSCYRRLWLFKHPDLYQRFINHLDQTRDRMGFKLWAYVVMPNHVHLLLFPGNDNTISKILFALKRPFAYMAVRYLQEKFPEISEKITDQHAGKIVNRFWQRGGGYDRNIYSENSLLKTINYINYNPVRKGLVKDAVNWKWSSARFWEEHIDNPIKIDKPWFWVEKNS